ncbi:hypothetical protein TRAPUB_8025 [Trametes pubescens]|uniref:Uncharacterized protein n=1 Tax=Trametes pubescens TaxID=154538 RepID=A0A1M2W6L5_TRAPU|nr:hypothetical protein TRAPUB_8025 [Trametes pubescens]
MAEVIAKSNEHKVPCILSSEVILLNLAHLAQMIRQTQQEEDENFHPEFDGELDCIRSALFAWPPAETVAELPSAAAPEYIQAPLARL